MNEVKPRPRIASEKFRRQEVAFEPITATARGDEIARRVHTALGEWEDVIDCGDFKVERSGAIDATPAAVTHHGVLNRALLMCACWTLGSLGATRGSGKAGETNAVIVSTPRQFHLAEKATPRNGSRSRSGASRRPWKCDGGGSKSEAAVAAVRIYRDVALEADS